MPWSIEKRKNEFCVVGGKDGGTVACHASRAKAVAHMRALYANEKPKAKASIDGQEFTVLVAKSFTERALGLSNLELAELEAAGVEGMVFVMPVETYSAFHMVGMKFPIEMAFFDVFGSLISQVTMDMQSSTVYRPKKPFKYVLEVPAGHRFSADARLELQELSI